MICYFALKTSHWFFYVKTDTIIILLLVANLAVSGLGAYFVYSALNANTDRVSNQIQSLPSQLREQPTQFNQTQLLMEIVQFEQMILTQQSGTAGAQVQLTAVNAQFVSRQLAIVLKNTGNKPITSIAYTLPSGLTGTLTPASGSLASPLLPGQEISYTGSLSGYTVGSTYQFVFTATASDGSVYSLVVSVQATSS